jgi:hypothetical protein
MDKETKKFYLRSLFIIVSVFFILFIVFINILESRKFKLFVRNILSSQIEQIANKEIYPDEEEFLIKNLRKIYLKYKPIIKEVIKED